VVGARIADGGQRPAALGAELRRQVGELIDEVAACAAEVATLDDLEAEFASACAQELEVRENLGLGADR